MIAVISIFFLLMITVAISITACSLNTNVITLLVRCILFCIMRHILVVRCPVPAPIFTHGFSDLLSLFFWPPVILNFIIILHASPAPALVACASEIATKARPLELYHELPMGATFGSSFSVGLHDFVVCLAHSPRFAFTHFEDRAHFIRWPWISSHSCEWIHYLIVAWQVRISITIVDLHIISINLYRGLGLMACPHSWHSGIARLHNEYSFLSIIISNTSTTHVTDTIIIITVSIDHHHCALFGGMCKGSLWRMGVPLSKDCQRLEQPHLKNAIRWSSCQSRFLLVDYLQNLHSAFTRTLDTMGCSWAR